MRIGVHTRAEQKRTGENTLEPTKPVRVSVPVLVCVCVCVVVVAGEMRRKCLEGPRANAKPQQRQQRLD